MTAQNLEAAIQELTDMQRKAVNWDNGPLLVLAGPGSGKTQVLTCRAARLLEDSPNERFRILGLTFTNKAAHEMKSRIAALAPDVAERAEINTFHGFCAQFLRQHGTHLGIKPDFGIYSRTADRQAALQDALRRQPSSFDLRDARLLSYIDKLKKHLVSPEQAAALLKQDPRLASDDVDRIASAYRLYEEELQRSNALDFNSLIYRAFELLKYPAFARLCQTIYRYWLIDEFQDTDGSQYRLLRQMTGDDFHQLFAVADDDQTIYEWNGARVHRIRNLVKDFGCQVIQLTSNFRCPPDVVEAANRLIVYNVRRSRKKITEPAAEPHYGEVTIQYRTFSDDKEEASHTADEVAALPADERVKTVVLGRSRKLLEPVQSALGKLNVPTRLLGRRDDFISPQMRWLVACLKQVNRPGDERNMAALAEAFESFTDISLSFEEALMQSKTEKTTLLSVWFDAVQHKTDSGLPVANMVADMEALASGKRAWTEVVTNTLVFFKNDDENEDLKDDLSAWYRIEREIQQDRSPVPLDQFLQEMEMRSKEPGPVPGSVSLGTIHGAKGLEFERVYLIGLAEEVFPCWHSVRKGDNSAEIEEERRSCFVAITRTRKYLTLSRAQSYRGWPKEPSRFLGEMGLIEKASSPEGDRGK